MGMDDGLAVVVRCKECGGKILCIADRPRDGLCKRCCTLQMLTRTPEEIRAEVAAQIEWLRTIKSGELIRLSEELDQLAAEVPSDLAVVQQKTRQISTSLIEGRWKGLDELLWCAQALELHVARLRGLDYEDRYPNVTPEAAQIRARNK